MRNLSLAIAALVASVFTVSLADTITWTGAAKDSWWGTGENWSGNGIPGESDIVTVGDGIAINANAIVTLPVDLTLGTGTSVENPNNELRFSGACIIRGGAVTANLLAAQAGSSSITIEDCALKNISTGHDKGFWRNDGTAHVNFAAGKSGAATYTFQTSLIDNNSVYGTFFAVSNPYVKYEGRAIASESEFNKYFAVTDNGDGTTTLSLKTISGWRVGTVAVGEVDANNTAVVSFTVTKYSGSDFATVYVGCASSDLGNDMSSWEGNLTTLAAGIAETTAYNQAIQLSGGVNYIRAFVSFGGSTEASSVAVVRVIVYGDYGELSKVYEFIGSDIDFNKPSNWALDKTPLTDNDTAPVAGENIRWFGRNAVLALTGDFHLYETDHFAGATITQANTDNHDSKLNGDVVFEDSNVTLSTVFVQSEAHTISLKNSQFTTTRAPNGVAGFWTTVPEKGINFISGEPSSFTFGADSGDVYDAATVKSRLVDESKIVLDGAAIDANVWAEHFDVTVVGTIVTVSYTPTVAANRIDSVSAVSTSTAATITATIGERAAGTLVKVAYGTAVPTDGDILSGTEMNVADATASAAVGGLVDLTVYHYVVAIVNSDSSEILASKEGMFVASDYDYVYMNGGWLGVVPALNAANQVLFLDNYNANAGDVNVSGKTVRGVSFKTGTLSGQGPLVAYSAQISNTRNNDLTGAPFGTYKVTAPLFDFHSLSESGDIRAACSYSFYTTRTDEEIYGEFFNSGNPLFQVDGAAATQDNFAIATNGTDINGDNVEYRNVSIVYWEPLPAGSADTWTFHPGARVKLAKNTHIGAVALNDSDDVKIDLNGFNLTVSALTVNGEKKTGVFTSAALPGLLAGDGSLVVGGRGFAVFIR